MTEHNETPSVVTGLLEDFPVEQLLVFLEACGVQGRLALTGGFEVNAMYLRLGMVVHAQDARGEGFDAFSRALLGDFERFSFEEGVPAPASTLSGSNAQLILTSMRRYPPSPRLVRTYTVPPGAMIFATKAAASHRAPVALSATETAILAAVAEGTAVESVADTADVDLTLTRHVLVRLASAGLVAILPTQLGDGADNVARLANVARLSPARRLTPSELLKRLHPTAPLGFRVSSTDAQVFGLVNGKRSVAEIGGLLGRDVATVSVAIKNLQGLGLILWPGNEAAGSSAARPELEHI